MPTASPLVTAGIPALALVVAGLVVAGLARATPPAERRRRLLLAAAAAVAWLFGTGALAASGLLARFDARPPPMLLLMAGVVLSTTVLGLGGVGARLAELPLAWLVGAQAFRLPLELVMHQAAAEGTMPPQLSFTGTGLNFDIVTGITAAVVAVPLARGKLPLWLLAAWNLLGFSLLATVATIGIASTPVFRAFGDDPAVVNSWMAYFPFVWLPTVLVAAALLGHLVVARRLLRERALHGSWRRAAMAGADPVSGTRGEAQR